METMPALPGLAGAVIAAAEMAEHAAGTAGESAALSLYGAVLDVARGVADLVAGSSPAGDVALALTMVYAAIMQCRAALDCNQDTAAALAAARRRGQAEGRREALAGRARSGRRRTAATGEVVVRFPARLA